MVTVDSETKGYECRLKTTHVDYVCCGFTQLIQFDQSHFVSAFLFLIVIVID